MARVPTTFYQADTTPDDSTVFEWATLDDDPFDRELDLKNLALALERHDHSNGRGKPSARITTNTVDTAAIQNNAVTTAKIADAQVTNAKLAANSVNSANIIDGTIVGVDLHPDAIKDRLGYIPVNKAGDTAIGTLAFAGHISMGGNTQIQLNLNAQIVGTGSISLTNAATGYAHVGSTAGATLMNLRNSGGSPGYSIGILNQAATAWELLGHHGGWDLGIPLVTTGITVNAPGAAAPIAVSNTTQCPNLNASLLQGLGPTSFAPIANRVPPGLHAAVVSAGSIPAGFLRATNCDGRIIVGAGTAAGVPGHPFTENAHAGSSWAAAAGAHTHTVESHTHFLGNAPDKNASSIAAGSSVIALARDSSFDTYPAGPWTTGPTGASADWNFPTYAMVWVYKT